MKDWALSLFLTSSVFIITEQQIHQWQLDSEAIYFKYPHGRKPGLINLKLFLTFCQALINQKSYRSQNLWCAWLTGYQRADDWLLTTDYCACFCVCVRGLRPGQSPLCCRPVTGANAGARGCTGLKAPQQDNTDRPPKAHNITHSLSHTVA